MYLQTKRKKEKEEKKGKTCNDIEIVIMIEEVKEALKNIVLHR